MPRYWFADDLPGKLQNWEGVLYLTLFPTSLSSSSWYQQLNFEVCLFEITQQSTNIMFSSEFSACCTLLKEEVKK